MIRYTNMAEVRRPYNEYGLSPRPYSVYGLRAGPYSLCGKYAPNPLLPEQTSSPASPEDKRKESVPSPEPGNYNRGSQDTAKPIFMRPVVGFPLRVLSTQRRAEYRRSR
jgi:hypothetical protein